MADSKNWHLARGFRFTGLHCGIRTDRSRSDLALVVSNPPASAAGVFTRNRVRAAPVRLCQERMPHGHATSIRGLIVCSGNANACTGAQGLADARNMTDLLAQRIGCEPAQVLVASTGVIGRLLPMSAIEAGVNSGYPQLADTPESLERLAQAILTTDTRIKVITRTLEFGDHTVHLTGVAKGAAMIAPNMATMLAFVFTDAAVAPADLHALLSRTVGHTFNCVRVEGHTSTNDTLLLLANGAAGGPILHGAALHRFEAGVQAVCAELARAIAADAEGASHLVTIDIEGLRDDSEAFQVARAIADSALVKTAIFGADPNWGRIVSAAGYAGVEFEEEQLSFWLGDLLLYHEGVPQPFDAATASAYLKRERNVEIRLRFTLGPGRCTVWTSDLTYEYVKLNADYTT